MNLGIRIGRREINIRHVVGFAILLLAWWWAADRLGTARLPTPRVVAEGLFPVMFKSAKIEAQGGGGSGMGGHLVASLIRVMVGGTIGIALGIGVGLLMGWSWRLNDLLQGPIEIVRAVPPLALAPFFLIWFGPTAETQYAMLILYLFLALVIATMAAIRNVPPVHLHYAATLGANRLQIYRTVVLPAIVPELVGAIRVGIALAWGIAVVTELLGAHDGMGKVFSMMLTAQGLDVIIIGIIWVTAVALVTDMIFLAISNQWTRWVARA
jgi:NitT/TauT family transport system permease protein/sulfonate transport system permease protein